MATPIFLIDLSEDSRNYRHTALEPGLPLLDRQHVNYQILRKWLGDYIAEPEWRADDTVAFYMTEDARGRLEDVDCHPVTRRELEKEFAADLETIRNKIKKIRPESSTEQMVHRILKKNIADQTNDLDSADFDSYFFKCRAGNEDPKLVWCVGYQRSDLEPLKARLWHTPKGEYLGVRPPDGGRAKKRKRKGPVGYLMNPWLAIAMMLLIALFVWQTWPKLVVTPGDWRGPLGSRVEYKVEDHRWYFFKTDVTPQVFPESTDPRVLDFGPHGAVADALSIGETFVSFRVGSQFSEPYKVIVTEPAPPDELVLQPSADVNLAMGGTQQMKAIGRYNDGNEVDLTNEVSWWQSKDSEILYLTDANKGLIQGDSVGTTQLFAQYPLPRDDGSYAEGSVNVQVALADFASLEIELSPQSFAVGQSSRVQVTGIAKDGQRHSLTGSSLLKLSVNPSTAADIDNGYLVGAAEGVGELTVSYDTINQLTPFNVKGVQDMFRVSPINVDDAVVYESIPVNVATSSRSEITAVSSNPDAVRVARTQPEGAGGEVYLAAVGLGSAEITVKQDDKSAVVKVTVVEGAVTDLAFQPPIYTLKMGQPETANLRGSTDTGRVNVLIDPAALLWEKTPRVENVYLDRDTLRMQPVETTLVPQALEVRLADTGLYANATVEVVGGVDLLAMDDAFGVHPPVPVGSRRLANGLLYDPERAGMVISGVDALSPYAAIPDGASIVEWNGQSLAGLSADQIQAFIRANPGGPGDIIRYMNPDGTYGTHFWGGIRTAVQDVKLMNVSARNLTADNFNAELRFYFREPGEYRIVGMDDTPLTDWAPYTADATPLITTSPIARNPSDDYDVWVVRRSDGVERKIQQQFKLEPDRILPVVDINPLDVVVPAPTLIDTVPDVDRVIIDDDDNDGTRVKRTTKRIIRHGDGASVIRDGDTYVTTQDVDRTIIRSGAGSPSAGSSTRAPDSANPSPGAPAPTSPSPSSPSPAPSSPSPAPPNSPQPNPAQPNPSPAPPGSDSKAPPSPAPPSPAPPSPAPPSPAPPSPAPAPPGSDSKAPPAPAPAPAPANPANPNPGSDTRPPSAYAQPNGSDTRPTGQPQPGVVGNPIRERTPAATGSGTRGTTLAPRPTGPSVPSDDQKKKDGTGLLDALKNYNRDWREDD